MGPSMGKHGRSSRVLTGYGRHVGVHIFLCLHAEMTVCIWCVCVCVCHHLPLLVSRDKPVLGSRTNSSKEINSEVRSEYRTLIRSELLKAVSC